MKLRQSMGNIAKKHHNKFDPDTKRNDGALGFFQRASPHNNNNNNNKNACLPVLHLLRVELRCKLQVILHDVTSFTLFA